MENESNERRGNTNLLWMRRSRARTKVPSSYVKSAWHRSGGTDSLKAWARQNADMCREWLGNKGIAK